jgi:hypothetical protein
VDFLPARRRIYFVISQRNPGHSRLRKSADLKLTTVTFLMLVGLGWGAITGSGTSGDPYLITTTADWTTFAGDSVTYWGVGIYAKLNGNLDFSDGTIAPCDAASGNYEGTFDGNGKIIANGTIVPVDDPGNHNGLFEDVGENACIQNLTFIDVKITGKDLNASSSYCGILTGEVTEGAVINNIKTINCHVEHESSQPNQYGYVGGIIGSSHTDVSNLTVEGGTVKADITATNANKSLSLGGVIGRQAGNVANRTAINCKSSAIVSDISGATVDDVLVGGVVGNLGIGAGICGYMTQGSFTGMIDYTSTSGNVFAGGLVGYATGNGNESLSDSSAEGTITVDSGSARATVGGIVGQVDTFSFIDSCCADVLIDVDDSGSGYVGGAFGRTSVGMNTITNCYAIGTVSANGELDLSNFTAFGGFVGYSDSDTFTNCFAAIGPWNTENTYQAGFVGRDLSGNSTFTGCIWDQTVVAFADTSGDTGTSSTTKEMKTAAPFSGFSCSKWKQAARQYPILKWQTYPLSLDEAQFNMDGSSGVTDECPAPPFMDSNGDCKVDHIDLLDFASRWLTCGLENQFSMDFNGDCKVDFVDFTEFALEWMSCGLENQSDCWE